MKQKQGLVIDLDEDGRAQVRIAIEEGGSGCPSRTQACHCRLGAKEITVNVLNKAGASPGDRVLVTFRPGAVVRSVAVLVGIPAIGLIIGVVVGVFLLQEMFLSKAGAVVAGGIPLGTGIGVAVFLYRRMFPLVQPFISRVLSKATKESPLEESIDPVCKRAIHPSRAGARRG